MVDPREMYESAEWAKTVIAELSYKPEWTFTIDLDRRIGVVSLYTKFYAPDSRLSERRYVIREDVEFLCGKCGERRQATALCPVRGKQIIPNSILESRNEKTFLRWLKYVIDTIEHHEIDEWFRFRGELVNDPHAEAGVR